MLSPIIFDRFTMGFSLSVHIVLAVIGIALPVIIAIAEFIGIRRHDAHYRVMAKRLSTVLIVLFAIGTASGMVVAIELFFLWPVFFQLVANVAILPLYAEVFAFFTEAIFLAMYFYAPPRLKDTYWHVLMMCMAALGAVASAVFITMINAFMNTPVGFNIQSYLSTGVLSGLHPFMVFNSPSTLLEVAHVVSSSYFAGAFIFLGYFAIKLLGAYKRNNAMVVSYYTKALKLTFALALIATGFAVLTGIMSISQLYHIQPEKYAALEADLVPHAFAAENLFNVVQIPDMQSILATGSPSGMVPGLSEFPTSTWPPYLILHDMFDFMVFIGIGIGIFLVLVLLAILLKRKPFSSRAILILLAVSSAFAVILLEDGWVLAEVGRQPWIIYNVMTVSSAANMSQSIIPIAAAIVAFYIAAIPAILYLLKRIFAARSLDGELVVQQ